MSTVEETPVTTSKLAPPSLPITTPTELAEFARYAKTEWTKQFIRVLAVTEEIFGVTPAIAIEQNPEGGEGTYLVLRVELNCDSKTAVAQERAWLMQVSEIMIADDSIRLSLIMREFDAA